MLRIAIVDDHQIVRAGFRELLADELGLEIVLEAASGEAALEALREQPVDVLLTGDSYRPIPLAPVAGALPAEAAVPATTEATTPEGDGYDY